MTSAQAEIIPKRGEIWRINFDPARGYEIEKTRPGVIISPNGLASLDLRIVVPLTTWQDKHDSRPWIVRITADPVNGLPNDSGADTFQVKSLTVGRFIRRPGVASAEQLQAISESIALCVGYAPRSAAGD